MAYSRCANWGSLSDFIYHMTIQCEAFIFVMIERQTTIHFAVKFSYRSRGKVKFLAGRESLKSKRGATRL